MRNPSLIIIVLCAFSILVSYSCKKSPHSVNDAKETCKCTTLTRSQGFNISIGNWENPWDTTLTTYTGTQAEMREYENTGNYTHAENFEEGYESVVSSRTCILNE